MNRAKPDIFICHADDTLDIARALRRHLAPDLRVFVPDDDLLAGDAWDDEVPARMGESPVVVVIVSPGWLADHWARDVLIGAIRQCRDDPRRRVVPVYTGGVQPRQALGLQRLKGYDLELDDMNRVVEGLRAVQPDSRSDLVTVGDNSWTEALPTRPALALIPPGRLLMGSPDDEFGRQPDEGPQREVSITRPLYMATTPVTRAQYAALLGRPAPTEAERPVVDVSWFEAADFCNRLSRSEGRAAVYVTRDRQVTADWTADGYRLPTEAEWEYACRAGTSGPFWTGSVPASLLRAAWVRDNSGERCPEVGQKAANPFGLQDMHATVWEWCHDWYASYHGGPTEDPRGPATGRKRVLRGGSFRADALGCRSAKRLAWKPDGRLDDAGFRLCRPMQ